MSSVRVAFVAEQTLGHVTHYQNLRAVTAQQTDVIPTWLPISFDVRGAERLVPLLRSNWSVRASWHARRALEAAVSRQRHHALVFHTQVTALFSVALMRRIPAVISLDATPINYDSVGASYQHRAAGNGFLDRQKFQLNQRAFQAAAGLVTWSEWAAHSLVGDYGVDPGRVRVLAPGAAPAYFDIGQRRAGQSAHPLAADRPVKVLFVGGDFQRKGGPLLLDCLRGALAGRCELHIVTQQEVAPERGVFVHRGIGPNSPELLRLFAEADIFVLPSRAECLAVVLMEATAAGLPVITTDVGALSEAVRPGESGFLIPAGDGPKLRGALDRLVGDAALRQRMGRSGWELACQKFDAHSNNQALLDLVVETSRAGADTKKAA
jgi:glycosyltransferase involved in cell wall biosynthesis